MIPKEVIFKDVASRAAKDISSTFDKNRARGHENREKCHCSKKDLSLLNLVDKTISGICLVVLYP